LGEGKRWGGAVRGRERGGGLIYGRKPKKAQREREVGGVGVGV